jgi:uncharacterized repeat protein (TIGR02543 family)
MVTVTGGTNGVGIGSGHNSADNGNISIKNAIIFANSISNTATYENAVTVIGSTTTFYDASGSTTGTNTVTLTGEYTILAGKTLTIPAGKTLTVTAGATLNVSGTLTVDANANFLVEPGALVSGTGTITGAPISNLAYSSITNTSITIHKPTLSQATGQTIEYAISTTNLPPNNGWQDVPATEDLITISSLDPNKTYYIFARSKAQVPYQTGIAKFLQVTTLYPVTVTFNSQGGSAISPDTQDKLSGETVDTVDSPTKTGYTFSYWYYKDNEQNEHPFTLASTLLTEANGVKITDNVGAIALYAKWSAKPVTITYQTDGTLAAGGTTTGTLGEQIGALATTSKTGYGFVWKNSDTVYSTETVLSEAAGVVLTGGEGNNTLTLTADWTAGPVAITYELNAGDDETAGLTNTPSDAGTYNSAIETFPTAKRTGYTLEGWYADSSVIDNQYGASTKINVGVTGDGSAGYKLELYAKWTAKPVTITYYRNDGTEAIYDGGEAASGTYDEKIAAAPTAPIRAGYTFGGWFKDEVAKNAWIFGDEGTALNADNGVVDADEAEPTLSLYAKWTANPPQTYAVTVNNGTGGGSFAAGDKVSITADALSGKIFDSWTGSVDFVNAGSPATSFVMPANAVTVTATYKDASVVVPPGSQVEEEGESIKVTLPDGGGSVVVPPGSTVTPGENEGEIEVTLPGEDAPVIVPPGSTVMPGENEGEIEVILPGDGGSVIVPPGSTVDAEGNVTVPPDNPPATENGWVKNEDGEWKYLVGGVAKTGWLYDTNYKAWFYLGTNGAMLTGWVYDRNDKAWYYLASNGKMVAGKWLHDTDGSWYYLSGNGKMLTGKQNIGGKTYSFRGNGVWIG